VGEGKLQIILEGKFNNSLLYIIPMQWVKNNLKISLVKDLRILYT
jgi:hypothetical protein